MQFTLTWERVLTREKTVTRRLVHEGDTLHDGCVLNKNHHIRFVIDDMLAVQPGRGKRAVARIRITGIRQEPVQSLTEQDARREGFANRDAFITAWQAMYAKTAYSWEHNPAVWVIDFELI